MIPVSHDHSREAFHVSLFPRGVVCEGVRGKDEIHSMSLDVSLPIRVRARVRVS